ncbi:MAG: ZIP family metal transporter [Candidatus Nanoarchaeia archaeon]|nr:ZIP family metal transporter [Candidatus Nanoarchaeia archaeon]
MGALIYTLLAVTAVSLISLIGILSLFFTQRFVKNISHYLIALSAGALLGAAFLDLLPESVEGAGLELSMIYILGGILVFFFIEKILAWHHCHHDEHYNHHKVLPYMILYGDIIHTFIDGVIIATAFLVDTALGVVTTIAIIMHEVPHEISDFFVLIYGGFSRAKALFYNFLVAMTHFVGVAAVYLVYSQSQNSIVYLLPIATGAFLYVAMADLMPELHGKANLKQTVVQLALMIFGVLIVNYAAGLAHI